VQCNIQSAAQRLTVWYCRDTCWSMSDF